MTEYNIGSVKFIHDELTWAQDKALTRLVLKLSNLAGGDESLSMKDLPPILAKHDLLGEFWGIILHRKFNPGWILELPWRIWRLISLKQSWNFVNLDPVTNTQLGEMFNDFFLINRPFMKKLSTFGNALGLIAQTTMNPPGPEKSSGKDSEEMKGEKLKSKRKKPA